MAFETFVNSTVYDSDDIKRFISKALPGIRTVKVRYMNSLFVDRYHYNPVTDCGESYDSTVHISRDSRSQELEIAFCRPSKLKVEALSWIASAAEGGQLNAPREVIKHLAFEASNCVYYTSDDYSSRTDAFTSITALTEGFTLRIHEKAKGRAKAQLHRAQEAARSAEQNLNYQKHMLDQAIGEVEYREREIELAEHRLKERNQKLKALQDKQKVKAS